MAQVLVRLIVVALNTRVFAMAPKIVKPRMAITKKPARESVKLTKDDVDDAADKHKFLLKSKKTKADLSAELSLFLADPADKAQAQTDPTGVMKRPAGAVLKRPAMGGDDEAASGKRDKKTGDVEDPDEVVDRSTKDRNKNHFFENNKGELNDDIKQALLNLPTQKRGKAINNLVRATGSGFEFNLQNPFIKDCRVIRATMHHLVSSFF